MNKMQKTLSFSICGDFITDSARDRFYQDHDLMGAIRILMGATTTDQLTETEHIILCLEILMGAKSIVGVYPGDDYGIEESDDIGDKNPLMLFLETVQKHLDKTQEIESELNDVTKKFSYVLRDVPDYKLDRLATEYQMEYDEPLFPDMERPKLVDIYKKIDVLNERNSIVKAVTGKNSDELLDTVIQKNRYSEELQETDYGWLEPNGTYHPVTWGDHQAWARKWLDKNRPEKEYPDLYGETPQERHRAIIMTPGDVLVNKLHWILLHSPQNGTARYIVSDKSAMTKAQREFLYDYYTKRNLTRQANELYKDQS